MDQQVAFAASPYSLGLLDRPQPSMDQNTRFYRHFQNQITWLQDQISQLGSIALVGGERQDAIESVQAGIAYLTKEVADVSESVPAYDLRTYTKALKELDELLKEELARLAPKARFQFKNRAPRNSDGRTDQRRLRGIPASEERPLAAASMSSHNFSSSAVDDDVSGDEVGALPKFTKNYNEELARPGVDIRKPSFSAARAIVISDHTDLHILLPMTAAKATSMGLLSNLTRCIVDMSAPAAGSAAFPTLTLKDISQSLIVAGKVSGSVHITGVRDSIVVVTAGQVRIHDCRDTQFYVKVTSHPIIEDCHGVRFAPLPVSYNAQTEEPTELEKEKNLWDQVDDFKWLKTEPSPNWSIQPENERVAEEFWSKTVRGEPGMGREDILKKAGVLRA